MLGALLGAALPAAINYFGQKDTNAKNMELGQKQMDFQERMSGTAHQREVKDLIAAGLNPILSATGGSGASSPSGSMPHVGNALGAAVSGAKQGAATMSELQGIEQSKAQTDALIAQAAKTRSETMDVNLNTAARVADIDRTKMGTGLANQQSQLTAAQILGATGNSTMSFEMAKEMEKRGGFAADVERRKAESQLRQMDIPRAQAQEEFFKDLGKANPYISQILQVLMGVSSAARAVGR